MHQLIRFVQAHETFRQPELEALATLSNTKVEVISYSPDSPYCIVDLQEKISDQEHISSTPLRTPDKRSADFISRSFLSKGIYELWAQATDYTTIHEIVKSQTQHLWSQYQNVTFKFTVDAYFGKRSMTEQKEIINSFSYLGFKGGISMKSPQVHFVVFEEWEDDTVSSKKVSLNDDGSSSSSTTTTKVIDQQNTTRTAPKTIYFCRYLGGTRRHLSDKHDLKKRPYISTTSMDALLALVTANLALAAPGKLILDPFVGTGGFMVAASELGAITLGSDIDGRSFRGGKSKGLEKGVGANFKRYGIQSLFGDCLTSDLTNTPFRLVSFDNNSPGSGSGSSGSQDHHEEKNRQLRFLDAIISDPPYGVREGLKVLGNRTDKPLPQHSSSSQTQSSQTDHQPPPPTPRQPYLINGHPAHLLPDYIAPKRPYSFTAMMNDIMNFAAQTLVDGGRLAFWMPSVNDGFNERLGEEKIIQRDNLINTKLVNEKEEQQQQQQKIHDEEEHETETELSNLNPNLPSHNLLTLKHICTQSFNKWSRKLLIYERVKGGDYYINSEPSISSIPNDGTNLDINNGFPIIVPAELDDPLATATTTIAALSISNVVGGTISSVSSSVSPSVSVSAANDGIAMQREREKEREKEKERKIADDLNPFRKAYFRGFQPEG